MTNGILRFRQLWGGGGGAFWPGPRKQGYGYRTNLKFATKNGTDDTSKHAKFKVISCSTFRDMMSQKFPFQKGTSDRDSIFTPWMESSKSLFTPENIFSGTKLYPPLHFKLHKWSINFSMKNSYAKDLNSVIQRAICASAFNFNKPAQTHKRF